MKTGLIIMISLLVLLVLCIILAVISYVYFYKKQHFECPKCGECFKPKVLNMIFSPNLVTHKLITCPKCGEYTAMKPIKDKDKKDKNPTN